MRKFEADYRIRETDDILAKEDAIHRDLDLRVDAIEQIAAEFRAGNRLDVDALVRNIEGTFSHLARDMRALPDDTAGGISADTVKETARRAFLTADRRAAILAELRGGVAAEADTLAKLYDALTALPTTADVKAAIGRAIDDLKGGASSAYDTLKEIETYIQDDKTVAASVAAALAKRVRFDAAQSLSAIESGQARANIGALAKSDLDAGLAGRVRYDAAQSLSDTESARARGNIGAASQADLDTGLGGRVAKGDYTGATIATMLAKAGSSTASATIGTLATRDSVGRSFFQDALNRSSGPAVVSRDERIGGMRWINTSTGSLGVLVDDTEIAYAATYSDERLKENIVTVADRDALARIEALRFVSFDWKAGGLMSGARSFGVLAQEVEALDPEWVVPPASEAGFYQLDGQGLLLSALRALQQTAERLRAVETRLAVLEGARS